MLKNESTRDSINRWTKTSIKVFYIVKQTSVRLQYISPDNSTRGKQILKYM